jgi:hypothetical protein
MGEAAVDRRAMVPFPGGAKHALGWAHRIEATDLTKVSKAIADIGGGSVSTRRERLSGEECHAQAAYVLLALMRGLNRDQYAMLRAYWLAPMSADKRELVERVAMETAEELDRPGVPLDWVMDVVGAWCNDRPYTTRINRNGQEVPWTFSDWAKHTGKPETTLSSWKNGGKRERGVVTVLQERYSDAEGAAVSALRDADLIP